MTSSFSLTGYNRFLLLVAGLGGLLYGVDVGIIGGALPYLQETAGLNPQQVSYVAASMWLGTLISTLIAGLLADLIGRKWLMAIAGALFSASIPIISLSQGYDALILGRLLQGFSCGLIGVVVPLYLAECLSASQRGKGTGIFQWLLTLGIVVAALIGIYYSKEVDKVALLKDAQKLFDYKDHAWRSIFLVSLPPGILFVIGCFLVAESPRWLFRRGKTDAARLALARSRSAEQVDVELKEMEATAAAEKAKSAVESKARDESLLHRKYLIPFVLACVILSCNQATGVNSIIGYNATILLQNGLQDVQAHYGYLILTVVNFLVTMAGVALVDRKGRKFLLSLGTAGVIVSLALAAFLCRATENSRVDVRDAVQAMVTTNQDLALSYDAAAAKSLLPAGQSTETPTTLVVVYSYGEFSAATTAVRSDDSSAKPIKITRDVCVPATKLGALSSHPFADLEAAKTAPLRIENALITPVPSAQKGWTLAVCLFGFMAFYAVGPGVCVWLALSELMPTRIRSNGMSFALLLNQAVSMIISGVFLPVVSKHGYASMFFLFAGCTVVYFITAAFFLPETKGKTLEEIEAHFEGH